MISAVVLTKNEEKNISECLLGLKWCDEVLVIDDNSTDETMRMAEEMGARVIKRSLNEDFAEQRNFALRQVYTEPLDFARDKLRRSARGEWVFFVDADEKVSRELEDEIKGKIKEENGIEGYFFKRVDFFMGKWLRHGEIGGIKILRLARKNAGKWARRVDEKWEVKGKTMTLENPLLHYPHQNLTEFLTSINERSTLNAKEFYLPAGRHGDGGGKITLIEWFKPLAKFIQNYFFRLGFLDGSPGFVFAVLMSFHSFLVRGKLYLLWKKDKRE